MSSDNYFFHSPIRQQLGCVRISQSVTRKAILPVLEAVPSTHANKRLQMR